MKLKWPLAFIAAFALLQFPLTANAFECPKHFARAQAAIDKVVEDMKGEMSKGMAKAGMAADVTLVHALLDDAKMVLAGAKHNHAKPRGDYDHGRAIAKANTALGYATAADIFHFKLMAKMPKK